MSGTCTCFGLHGVAMATPVRGRRPYIQQARGSDGSTYTFDADMRFMQGHYSAGSAQTMGTFGFV